MEKRHNISKQLQRLSKGNIIEFSRILSDHLGVSKQCILSWIYGMSNPTHQNVKKIATYFHISANDFLNDKAKVKLPWAQRVLVLEEGYLNSSDIKSYIEFSSPRKIENGKWVQR